MGTRTVRSSQSVAPHPKNRNSRRPSSTAWEPSRSNSLLIALSYRLMQVIISLTRAQRNERWIGIQVIRWGGGFSLMWIASG
jgi:hypothetical protein